MTCECGKSKNHCDPCAGVVVSTKRGSGRTLAMVRALPVEDTPTVVVHTQAMADYVRDMARRERPDLRHPLRVRIVDRPRDVDYLRGADFVVDHAVWEHVEQEARDLLRALDRRARRV